LGCTSKIGNWVPQLLGRISKNGNRKILFWVKNEENIIRDRKINNPWEGLGVGENHH